jgi:hypothetical protein
MIKPLTESIKTHPESTKTHPEAFLFSITFIRPSTGEVQKHVDFDLIMMHGNKPIYQVSNHTGQMGNIPLHTTDGFVDIPVLTNKILGPGLYSIKIPIRNPFQSHKTRSCTI